ncbi:hypothetical protein F5Y15DRAFT_24048 [Xylariaceae sp. FL0016]|nr:hypothetical protein F5Y15DRAFT_24048 [Xylariaceae sp. FL0016]
MIDCHSLMNICFRVSELDLFYHVTLVAYLVVFLVLHGRRLHSFASTMADTLSNPQTPPRKLFKPSSRITTPTQVKRRLSTASTLSTRSLQSIRHGAAPHRPSRVFSNVSQSTPVVLRKAPVAGYARSDTTGDTTPIGLIDNDVFTPSETLSRSTGGISRQASETFKNSKGKFKKSSDSLASGSGAKDNLTGSKPGSDAKESVQQTLSAIGSARGNPGKSKDAIQSLARSLPQVPDDAADRIDSPSKLAQFFAENGHPEMSNFVKALLGDSDDTTMNSDTVNDGSQDSGLETPRDKNLTAVSPILMEELPTDDKLITEPNERTKEATRKLNGGSLRNRDKITTSSGQNANGQAMNNTFKNAPEAQRQADVSKKAEGAVNVGREAAAGVASTDATGAPDTSNISKEAQVGGTPSPRNQGAPASRRFPVRPLSQSSAKVTPNPAQQRASNPNRASVGPDDTQSFDNMGRPAHIQRRVDVPLQKASPGQPQSGKPNSKNATNSLGEVKDLPSTDNLGSLDDLPDIPDDESQDPPEEVLDPSVHSASSNITPIPNIPKIAPIGSVPNPDLRRLARGLGGHIVDDVGNIVDDSENVLGHVTGDLPAMIGKEVAENGEVYGDEGEVIGYVSENFINPPTPTEIPNEVLGGLRVDHNGNILDSNGNAIGRFNEKPGANGSLAPYLGRNQDGDNSAQGPKPEDESNDDKKPKVNAHTGGSPSDIFLDVKSTTDGIQLTIRIPTTFQKKPHD